jgi:hypothetical protein
MTAVASVNRNVTVRSFSPAIYRDDFAVVGGDEDRGQVRCPEPRTIQAAIAGWRAGFGESG